MCIRDSCDWVNCDEENALSVPPSWDDSGKGDEPIFSLSNCKLGNEVDKLLVWPPSAVSWPEFGVPGWLSESSDFKRTLGEFSLLEQLLRFRLTPLFFPSRILDFPALSTDGDAGFSPSLIVPLICGDDNLPPLIGESVLRSVSRWLITSFCHFLTSPLALLASSSLVVFFRRRFIVFPIRVFCGERRLQWLFNC